MHGSAVTIQTIYSLVFSIDIGILKRRVQIVEIVHSSAVTIQALYSLVYSITIGILKHRVQIVEIVHSSAVTIYTLYSLVYSITIGILNHRVQMVEIVHGSAVTILALYSLVYSITTGILKCRVQIVKMVHGSAVTIQALYSLVYSITIGILKHRVQIVEIVAWFSCHYPGSFCSLVYSITIGILKHRVQIVETVHGSAVTIYTLYSLVYSITIGILKCRVQIVEIVHGSAVTILALYSLVYSITIGILKHRVQIVEIVHGSAVTIQMAQSDVILHVPDGVYGIILGNIHIDHWRFRHLVSENDCIIGPICEFFHKGAQVPEWARFCIQVPHIVKDISSMKGKIGVKHIQKGDISIALPLTPKQNPSDVYYSHNDSFVEISTGHFCQFIPIAKGTNCCNSASMIALSELELDESGCHFAKIGIHFSSPHYDHLEDYRRVSN